MIRMVPPGGRDVQLPRCATDGDNTVTVPATARNQIPAELMSQGPLTGAARLWLAGVRAESSVASGAVCWRGSRLAP